jgi:hypothetical protein
MKRLTSRALETATVDLRTVDGGAPPASFRPWTKSDPFASLSDRVPVGASTNRVGSALDPRARELPEGSRLGDARDARFTGWEGTRHLSLTKPKEAKTGWFPAAERI